MNRSPRLSRAQQRAIERVASRSGGGAVDPSLRVTLHFHPDRLLAGVPILEAMARDGVYRSQFETGTSNGGLTAHPGGDRWEWESRIFAGAYDHSPPPERPKYGSLNYRRRLVGGSPRFGSAHLRLRPETMERVTFCYPDSVFEPTDFGVAAKASSLIAMATGDAKDALDDYIEAQIHGPVTLAEDVEALVLDPCYRDTIVEHAANRLGCRLEFHPGFRLGAAELRRNPEYRGRQYVELGLSLMDQEGLTPKVIGDASRTGSYDEQALKRVWHCTARFGTPELANDDHRPQ
ncbi:DUF3626 domain-containing protein [Saccharopolyspora sp. NPDC003752]